MVCPYNQAAGTCSRRIRLVNMWAAVFADVGVAVIAIANSMRALRVK